MLEVKKLTASSAILRENITCGFCHNPFLPGEEIVICPQCGAVHHTSCWQANGYKCATHLCSGTGKIKVSPVNPDSSDDNNILVINIPIEIQTQQTVFENTGEKRLLYPMPRWLAIALCVCLSGGITWVLFSLMAVCMPSFSNISLPYVYISGALVMSFLSVTIYTLIGKHRPNKVE